MKIDLLFVWIFLGFAIVLLFLTQRLFGCIRRDDETLYLRLGMPDLFRNNDTVHVYTFWKWIFMVRLGATMSMETRTLVWILRVATPIYLLGIAFGGLAVLAMA